MSQTQMLKGILDGCVLSIIKTGKLFSQEIIVRLKESGFTDISEGTMFPLMLRLEKEEFVYAEKQDNPLGASRKYYSLSAKGREALNGFTAEWNSFKHKVNKILEVE